MISQFHCEDKQFGNSYVRVCVVSNRTMGLFGLLLLLAITKGAGTWVKIQSHSEVRHYTDTVQRTTSN